MSNLYAINKEYEEILSGLNFKEIGTYYRNIYKKMLETYPSFNSNEWNVEEHNKIFDSIEEATNIFKKSFPSINVVKYHVKFEELEDKYLKELDLGIYKILTSDLNNIATSIAFQVNAILLDLASMYHYYNYISDVGTHILEIELDVPEELLEPLKPYFTNRSNSSFYGSEALSYLNEHIKVNFKVAEMYIEVFNDFERINFSVEDDVPSDLAEVLNTYNKFYDLGIASIKQFEEMKAAPFKKAIELEAAVKVGNDFNNFTEDEVEKFIESELASAPKYNFETFELIVPENATEEGVVN